jgi:hypothetical protein
MWSTPNRVGAMPLPQGFGQQNAAQLSSSGGGGGASSSFGSPFQPRQMPSAQMTQAQATPAKKEGILGKLLPMLFRFGLPIAAGAAIGGNSGGAFNPLSGALLGATGGGLNYLGEKNLEKKLATNLETAKIKAQPAWMRAQTDLGYKTGRLQQEKDKLGLLRQQGESLDNYRKRVASAKEKEVNLKVTDKTKTPKSSDPFGKFLEDASMQFGGQQINPDDPNSVAAFKVFIDQSAPKMIEDDTGFFGGGTSTDEKLNKMIMIYNQRVQNAGAAPTQAGPAAAKTPQQLAMEELQRRGIK